MFLPILLLNTSHAQTPVAVVEEVPFITTPDNVTLAMLKLAQVGPTDFVLDLGSGDGRIVITAAKRFGARGLGVEIVPDLVASSRAAARVAGVEDRVDFQVQDLFKTNLSAATVITLYLLPDVNLQLRPLLLKLAPGTRIVSHDWDMGAWQPDQTLTVAAPDKKIGREKLSRLHRWVVPASAAGLWCGPGGETLRVQQQFQAVQASWTPAVAVNQGNTALPVADQAPARLTSALFGHVNGTGLHLFGSTPWQGQLQGNQLLVQAHGSWPQRVLHKKESGDC